MFSFKRFVTDLMLYRKAMLVSLLIFAAGVALGAANADTLTRLILSDLEKLGEYSRQLSQTETPELHFFTFIFLNNALKSVAIMVLGGLLGIMPGVFLLMNGVALGYVVAAAGSRGEHVLDLIVRGLLPHGIIEIPAILIASGFWSSKVWASWALEIRGKERSIGGDFLRHSSAGLAGLSCFWSSRPLLKVR